MIETTTTTTTTTKRQVEMFLTKHKIRFVVTVHASLTTADDDDDDDDAKDLRHHPISDRKMDINCTWDAYPESAVQSDNLGVKQEE
ncbi:hypothetical protein PAMP_000871 [Pampus punctatissimus]